MVDAVEIFQEPKKTAMMALFFEVEEGFWEMPRNVQLLELILKKTDVTITQKDVAEVMDVHPSLMTKIKRYYQAHPHCTFMPRGRPSELSDVFNDIQNFIDSELREEHSVTLGVLIEYIADHLDVFVERKRLLQFMKRKGYAYVSALPTEDVRVNFDRDALRTFYTTALPSALEGVHPSLVFNMDEMGAERYADLKRVNVIIPNQCDRVMGWRLDFHGRPTAVH